MISIRLQCVDNASAPLARIRELVVAVLAEMRLQEMEIDRWADDGGRA